MAIKASITITISKYRDCDSITRYFKLQASTAAAPAIPTTLIPSSSDWSTTEPNYTSGSTNTLYYTDKYVFSDGTFQYTDDGNGKAIKSSSYEAAKEAYNKAQNAQNIANNVNNNLNNMDFNDKNLLFNYQKMRQDNSQWDRTNIIFDTTDLPEDDELNFKMNGIARTSYYIPFNKSHSYKFEAWFKAVNTHKTNVNLFYPSIEAYDADKLWIEFKHSLQRPNTITTTVQDINPGDTVIYADDLTNWDVSANHPYYYVGIYNYKSSQGIEYNKYTRNICKFGDYGQPKDNINKTNNTITLQKPYSGPVIPSGTNIAQNGEGSTYIYPFAGISYSSVAEWTKLIMSDTKLDIHFDVRLESTSYIRYLNFNQYFWLYNPKLYDVTSEEELKNINDSLEQQEADIKSLDNILNDENTGIIQIVDVLDKKLTSTEFGWLMDFQLLASKLKDKNGNDVSINDINNSLNNSMDDLEIINKYISFENGNIILGEKNAQSGTEGFKLILSNDKISFMDGEQEVAYITNKKLYISESEIKENSIFKGNVQLGDFAFIPRYTLDQNGNKIFSNLSFKKVGG